MLYKNPNIQGMGSEEGSEYKLRTVDPLRIKKIRSLAESAKVS
jgi:copper homeostasis protein